jgi:hypothetical protein
MIYNKNLNFLFALMFFNSILMYGYNDEILNDTQIDNYNKKQSVNTIIYVGGIGTVVVVGGILLKNKFKQQPNIIDKKKDNKKEKTHKKEKHFNNWDHNDESLSPTNSVNLVKKASPMQQNITGNTTPDPINEKFNSSEAKDLILLQKSYGQDQNKFFSSWVQLLGKIYQKKLTINPTGQLEDDGKIIDKYDKCSDYHIIIHTAYEISTQLFELFNDAMTMDLTPQRDEILIVFKGYSADQNIINQINNVPHNILYTHSFSWDKNNLIVHWAQNPSKKFNIFSNVDTQSQSLYNYGVVNYKHQLSKIINAIKK